MTIKHVNIHFINILLTSYVFIHFYIFCFESQDGLTGSAWGDWANYTDSPLRAFEGELGVP